MEWKAYSRCKKTLLCNVSRIERAQNGKTYPAGCTLIPLSASDFRLIQYQDHPAKIESRYAVVQPNDEVNGYYLYVSILQSAQEFFYKYQTGINLQLPILLKYFTIRYHGCRETQDEIEQSIKLIDSVIHNVEFEIKTYKDMKKNMLDRMMI